MSGCDSRQQGQLAREVNRLRNEMRQLRDQLATLSGITGICVPSNDGIVPALAAYNSGTQVTTLEWVGLAGRFYTVEKSTDLASWTTVAGAASIPANETPGEYTEFVTPAAAPPLAYRVRLLPAICT